MQALLTDRCYAESLSNFVASYQIATAAADFAVTKSNCIAQSLHEQNTAHAGRCEQTALHRG
jgi:hypothetical protein